MPKINVLSADVAQLIAAGEVVERPSSVIKEMLENSIDASSTSITVEIKNGGSTYMRITDNGCGIEHDDIRNVFVSHATSKIADKDDLDSILTLGFRGEAMASIARVSHVEMITKTKDSDFGFRYTISGSEEKSFDEAGCPDGTTIVVRDLFYNTPARMKFLKKDVTEGNAVSAVVDRLALSHPEISFRFIRDGKQTLLTPGDGNLYNTIYAVCGADFAKGLLKVDYEYNGVKVSGYITKPTSCRANRAMQFFFVNNRLVQSKTCFAALDQAYKNSVMVGKFPACVLNVEIDPSSVDVNVHPAKIEVRFVNERPVFETVLYACKSALENAERGKEVYFDKPKTIQSFLKKEEPPKQYTFSQNHSDNVWQKKSVDEWNKTVASAASVAAPKFEEKRTEKRNDTFENVKNIMDEVRKDFTPANKVNVSIEYDENDMPAPKKQEETTISTASNNETINEAVAEKENENSAQLTENTTEFTTEQSEAVKEEKTEQIEKIDFKLIGEAFKTYILVEIENELYIIDKHAAHERIIFERLKSEGSAGSQVLMQPVTIRLSKEEYSVLLENEKLLWDAGFLIEDFGGSNVIVRECPVMLADGDIESTVVEIAGKLLSGKTDIETQKLEHIYHSTACRSAVKAGDFTSRFEMEKFVEELLSRPEIRFCPHGRPVMIKMSKYEIEKQFGRV